MSQPVGHAIYSEVSLWSKVLKPLLEDACRTGQHRAHFQRIENMAGVGNPDVEYCIAGNTGHIELKQAKKNPKSGTTVLGRGKGMRRSQLVWATRRTRAAGRVFLCIGVPSRALWLIDLRGTDTLKMVQLEMLTSFGLDQISSWRTGQDPLHLLEVLRS